MRENCMRWCQTDLQTSKSPAYWLIFGCVVYIVCLVWRNRFKQKSWNRKKTEGDYYPSTIVRDIRTSMFEDGWQTNEKIGQRRKTQLYCNRLQRRFSVPTTYSYLYTLYMVAMYIFSMSTHIDQFEYRKEAESSTAITIIRSSRLLNHYTYVSTNENIIGIGIV